MNFEEFFITRDAVVTIKIPHQFVGELYRDRFRETFERVKADFHCLAGNYERETIDMLIEAFKNAEVKDAIIKKQFCNNLRVYRVAIEDYAENLWIVYLTASSTDQATLKAIRSYNMEPSINFCWRQIQRPEPEFILDIETLNHWIKIPKERRPFKNDKNQQINNHPAPEKRKGSRLSKTCKPDPVPAELEDTQE